MIQATLLRVLDSPTEPVPVGDLSKSLNLWISTSGGNASAIELFEVRRHFGNHRAAFIGREIETRKAIRNKTLEIRHRKTSSGG